MTRRRVRPAYSDEDLAALYGARYDHTRWPDHRIRVDATAALIHAFAGPVGRAADLSCGDGAILARIHAAEKVHGDLTPGWELTGPCQDTITALDPVDLLVCSETLEHLDDPDAYLAAARGKAATLVLSTPMDEPDPDTNPEHYWAWGADDVEQMLRAAGWCPNVMTRLYLSHFYCDYQLWIAR